MIILNQRHPPMYLRDRFILFMITHRVFSSLIMIWTILLQIMIKNITTHIPQTTLDEATDPWGVKVERVEM